MRKPYRKTPSWRNLCGTMQKIRLAALLVSVAAASSIATIAAQKHVQKSTVYPWSATDAKPNEWGTVRQVMRAPTPTLDELEIHISTLNPGKSPHAPHQHAHEELLIVKDGTLETFQSGATRRVGSGGIIFQASNELHNVTNVGQTPATYFVIGWTVPGVTK
jgi:XRE family transcriptional regulator, regulator of sulfur utilization